MLRAVCIGAGRLALHLMPQLPKAGLQVVQIYNRSLKPAEQLAQTLKGANVTQEISELEKEAEYYFITVSDDAIGLLTERLRYLDNGKSIFVHCSGMLGLDAIPFQRRGVFYPLQSFSANQSISWKETPILICSDNIEVAKSLEKIAIRISQSVHQVNDRQKSALHLAAVFANNFVNHMWTLAERICQEHRVSFDILKPLIRQTLEKAMQSGPTQSQTGPAVRGDEQTIEKHLQMLSEDPELSSIYLKLSENIMKSNFS